MHLFGRKKQQKDPKTSIMQLREALDLLDKREKVIQQSADRQHQVAVQNAGKNKNAALMALRRKKLYENQISRLQGSEDDN